MKVFKLQVVNESVTLFVTFTRTDLLRNLRSDTTEGVTTHAQPVTPTFDDLCHAFRKPRITLKDHQPFLLNGIAWKRGAAKPLDGLTKQELQQELLTRERNGSFIRQRLAPHITTMKKQLQAEFSEQNEGFSNFTALLITNPTANLSDLHLAEYEVAPTEQLHDFKGHMANVIGEVRSTTTSSIREEVESHPYHTKERQYVG